MLLLCYPCTDLSLNHILHENLPLSFLKPRISRVYINCIFHLVPLVYILIHSSLAIHRRTHAHCSERSSEYTFNSWTLKSPDLFLPDWQTPGALDISDLQQPQRVLVALQVCKQGKPYSGRPRLVNTSTCLVLHAGVVLHGWQDMVRNTRQVTI